MRRGQIMSEDEYYAKLEEFGDGAFTAIMGAEGVRELLRSIDIDREVEVLRVRFESNWQRSKN